MGFTIFGILVLLMFVGCIAGGTILLITSRRRGLGYPACGACHYNLSGTIGSGTRCPECGADIADAGIVPSRGRRSRLRMWIGIVIIAAPLTCFGAMLFAGVRQTRQIQSANSRANAAAATNAQLKLQTEAANAEQRKAAENLERLRSQLESMQSQGKAAGVNVEEMQKSLDEAKRKLEELKKRQEATPQGSDAMEVNGNAASKPNQPITPDER